ncbi:MAG: M24 family metallopeptidase [Clostridia bacterium]
MFTKIEQQQRTLKVANLLQKQNISAVIICSNVNLLYVFGEIFNGYGIITATGKNILLTKSEIKNAVYFNKPKEIIEIARENGLEIDNTICFDDEFMTASDYLFLSSCFKDYIISTNTKIFRLARMIKTDFEVEQILFSAKTNDRVYKEIPNFYKKHMTDIELQVAIESYSRSLGHLGIFRTFGGKMECFMGSLLAGDNASSPSPFDFALGGKGSSVSLPIGASGNEILPNQTIMVDLSGNVNGYLSDMSRTFYIGTLPNIAYKAYEVSEEIHHKCCELMEKKAPCSELWNVSLEIAEKNNLTKYFMGNKKQAKFVGHGLGLEINELPVLTAKDTTLLQNGMVIALEPKFAIPGVGAIGNEDTYLICKSGYIRLTAASRELIKLD